MTLRAFLVGLALCAILGVWIPYSDMLIQGSRMGLWCTQSGAIFLFFLVAFAGNTALALMRRSWAFGRDELLAIFIMTSVANAVPSRGVVANLFPLLTSAWYYATAENEWARLLLPHLPRWMTVADAAVVTDLYEGLPPGVAMPWGRWLAPLAAWAVFFLALHWMVLSAAVLLRRQWMEHERIPYPMAQLPLAMVAADGRAVAPFFRHPLMWIGFALPLIDGSFDALHRYYPFLPSLTVFTGSLALFRDTVTFGLHLDFAIVGFAYFTSTAVGYGLCFFHALNLCQRALLDLGGLGVQDPMMGVFSQYQPSMLIHQSMGAMLVLVLFGVWIGRGHIGAVLRGALRRGPAADDGDEIMSYRAAVIGLAGGGLVMAAWLALGGLPWWVALLFVATTLIIFIALTRAVAQGGVPAMYPPTNPSDVIISGLGPGLIGNPGLATLGLTYVWGTDILNFAMAPAANGLRLAAEVTRHRRRLSVGIMAGIAAAMAGAMWMNMVLCYEEGGLNLNGFYYQGAAQYPWTFLEKIFRTLPAVDPAGWAYTGVGGGIMAVLMWLRRRFLWWPFHPLGFPISSVFGSMWFSVLFAMLLKSAALKYGGVRFYTRTQPLFLGLILGQVFTAGLWLLLDAATGMKGNGLFLGM